MKRILVAIVLSVFLALPARAQLTGSPIATAAAFQFFDNSGLVLAGGKICTYQAGTSTLLATYTDYSLTVPQSNPVILDSAGRVQGGGIFIGSQPYKLIALQGGDGTCSTGVTLWSQDHITSASTTVNGLVGSLTITGTANQVSVAAAGTTITLGLPAAVATQQFTATAAGSAIAYNSANLLIDGNGNLTTARGAGTGGNIIAAGYVDAAIFIGMAPFTSTPTAIPGSGYGALTYKGISGTDFWFYNQVAGAWQTVDFAGGGGGGTILGTANQITVTASGGVSTISLPATIITQTFSSTSTGVAPIINATNFTVTGDADVTISAGSSGHGNLIVRGTSTVDVYTAMKPTSGTPGTVPLGGYAALTYKGGTSGLVFWVYDAVHSTWSAVDLGAAGGSGITSLNGQTGSAQTIAGTSAQITATTTSNTVTLSLPTTITTQTFNSTSTGAAAIINATNFTVTGDSDMTLTAGSAGHGNIIVRGTSTVDVWTAMKPTAGTPGTAPLGGYGGLTYKGGTSGLVFWVYDAVHTTWSSVDFAAAGGGVTSVNGQTGAVTIAGTALQVAVATATGTVTLSLPSTVQTNQFTATNASSSLDFSSPNLTIDGTGLLTTQGSVFITQSARVDRFYAMKQTAGTPGTTPASTYGALTYQGGGSGLVFWVYNAVAAAWQSVDLATVAGGVSSLNGLTGTLSIAATANQTTVSAFGSTVTIGTSQNISTSSSPQFTNVGATATFSSSATGSTIALQTNNGNLHINGNGDVSGVGSANFFGGFGSDPYQVSGTGFIDTSRNLKNIGNITGSGTLNMTTGIITAGGIGAAGFNPTGFIGQTWNVGFSSPFTINGSGSFTTLVFKGGVLATAFNIVGGSRQFALLWALGLIFWVLKVRPPFPPNDILNT